MEITKERRSQADRRAETQAAIMKSAVRLFGENGYNNTSLEDIANDCGISIAPIYHYFSNKKNLFLVVCTSMEEQIMNKESSTSEAGILLGSWRNFLNLCADPYFRRIVLVDGPIVLGRERTFSSDVFEWSIKKINKRFNTEKATNFKAEIAGRMLVGALAEAGLFVGNSDNHEQAAKDAEELVTNFIQSMVMMKLL